MEKKNIYIEREKWRKKPDTSLKRNFNLIKLAVLILYIEIYIYIHISVCIF